MLKTPLYQFGPLDCLLSFDHELQQCDQHYTTRHQSRTTVRCCSQHSSRLFQSVTCAVYVHRCSTGRQLDWSHWKNSQLFVEVHWEAKPQRVYQRIQEWKELMALKVVMFMAVLSASDVTSLYLLFERYLIKRTATHREQCTSILRLPIYGNCIICSLYQQTIDISIDSKRY